MPRAGWPPAVLATAGRLAQPAEAYGLVLIRIVKAVDVLRLSVILSGIGNMSIFSVICEKRVVF